MLQKGFNKRGNPMSYVTVDKEVQIYYKDWGKGNQLCLATDGPLALTLGTIKCSF